MTAAAKEFTITLNEIDYPVTAEGDTITVNGRPFTVEVNEDGTVLVDGIAYDVALEEETATVGDNTHTVQASGLSLKSATPTASLPTASPEGKASAGAVVAIMPGQIIRVMVEQGQEVQDGEPVCVLEAMKMENELHAHQDGVVKAVHVQPGDDVEKDQVLVEIE
jgi:biotin carboxyl carrier protein